MTIEIPLTKSKLALVDAEDVERLLEYDWYATWTGWNWYAVHDVYRRGVKVARIRMHREVLHAPQGTEVDHNNGNTLDNRRSNLRFATSSQGKQNRRKSPGTSSQYKGVQWSKRDGKWLAVIGVGNKHLYLGLFALELDAAAAYDVAARKHFGEFACLNFPQLSERSALSRGGG